MHLEPYQPRTHEIFWCAKCDNAQVDSADTSTGNFYVQFGHTYNQRTRSYDGEYTGVMFALCSHCRDATA